MKLNVLVTALAFSAVIFSCKKDPQVQQNPPVDPPAQTETNGQVFFEINPTLDGQDLVFNTRRYRNAAGDSLIVNNLNYYISNIRLKKADGTFFTEPESYHLNKHAAGRNSFTISGVPAGTYSAMEFVIGVDSLRNSSGAQTGALDVKEDMFWGWNQGYIFLKIEGDYKNAANPLATPYGLHVGNYECIEKASLTFNTPLVVSGSKQSSVHLLARVDSIFNGETDLDLDTYATLTTRSSKTVSTNYRGMFAVFKIEN